MWKELERIGKNYDRRKQKETSLYQRSDEQSEPRAVFGYIQAGGAVAKVAGIYEGGESHPRMGVPVAVAVSVGRLSSDTFV